MDLKPVLHAVLILVCLHILEGRAKDQKHLEHSYETLRSEEARKQLGDGFATQDRDKSIRTKRETTHLCSRLAMCSDRTQSSDFSCYCDQLCHIYDDCCYDAPAYENLQPNASVEKATNSRCFPIPRFSGETIGVEMVVGCPSEGNRARTCFKDDENGNSTNQALLPVTGFDDFIYVNSECAKCNGVTNYYAWEIVFNVNVGACSISLQDIIALGDKTVEYHEDFARILLDKNCEFSYYGPPSFFTRSPRLCFPNIVEVPGCDNHTMPIKVRNSSATYKTVGCCLKSAMNGSDDGSDACAVDEEACPHYTSRHGIQSVYIESASDPTVKTPQLLSLRHQDDGCLNLSRHFYECTPVRLINFLIPLRMKFSSNVMITEEMLCQAALVLKAYLSNTIFHLTPENKLNYTRRDSSTRNEALLDLNLRTKTTFYTTDELNLLKDWLSEFSFEYKEMTLDTDIPGQRMISSVIKTTDKAGWKDDETERGVIDLVSAASSNFRNSLARSRRVPYHMCKKLDFNMTVNGTDVTTAWHCDYRYSYYIKYVKRTRGSEEVDAILTYACFSVSCFSLLLSFPLHRCSQMSKTVPGKNMENLMVTLFLSQMCFMFGIGQHDQSFCMVFSVLIHYFFLCSFCWMNLCMLHIMFVLSRMKKYPNQSLNSTATCRRFAPLVISGYTLPACIVIPCVLIDFVLDTEYNVGYIAHGICFPSNYPENLYVFVIPICVSLGVNILCLLRVIFIINTAVPDGFDNIKFRRYVPVYLKLTIVSGLSWLFGIAGEALDNAFLRYSFIIFTGLQGLLLCVSFVFSGRVWTDVKSRVLCCNEQDPTTTMLEMSTKD